MPSWKTILVGLGSVVLAIADVWLLFFFIRRFGQIPMLSSVAATTIVGLTLVVIRWKWTFSPDGMRETFGDLANVDPFDSSVFRGPARWFLLLAAIACFLTPGFITDLFGFLLLIPFIRDWLAEKWVVKMVRHFESEEMRPMVQKARKQAQRERKLRRQVEAETREAP